MTFKIHQVVTENSQRPSYEFTINNLVGHYDNSTLNTLLNLIDTNRDTVENSMLCVKYMELNDYLDEELLGIAYFTNILYEIEVTKLSDLNIPDIPQAIRTSHPELYI